MKPLRTEPVRVGAVRASAVFLPSSSSPSGALLPASEAESALRSWHTCEACRVSACGRGGEWKDLGPKWIWGQGLSTVWRWRRWRAVHRCPWHGGWLLGLEPRRVRYHRQAAWEDEILRPGCLKRELGTGAGGAVEVAAGPGGGVHLRLAWEDAEDCGRLRGREGGTGKPSCPGAPVSSSAQWGRSWGVGK